MNQLHICGSNCAVKPNLALAALVCVLATGGWSEDSTIGEFSGHYIDTFERERQIQRDQTQKQQQEMRRDFLRALAHARMPTTMYASTPLDENAMPHAFSDVHSRFTSMTELKDVRRLQSKDNLGSTVVTQKLKQLLDSLENKTQASTDSGLRHKQNRSRNSLGASSQYAVYSQANSTEIGLIPYIPSASDPSGQRGVIRLLNRESRPGEVTIFATDDHGTFYEPILISLGEKSALQFDSSDLEQGNLDKGLRAGTGPGRGAWILELSTTVDIEVLAFLKSSQGVMTPIHDDLLINEDDRWFLHSDVRQGSKLGNFLRIVNRNPDVAKVVISHVGTTGELEEQVTLEIPGFNARSFSTGELEIGSTGDLSNSFHNSPSRGQLRVETTPGVWVFGLRENYADYMTRDSNAVSVGYVHHVPLFISASDPYQRLGLLHISNHEDRSGTVSIQAFDDAGREYEPLELSLNAGERKELDSNDLELGNRSKGLSDSTGSGEGDWRFELSSELDLEVFAFVQTRDDLVMPVTATIPLTENRHEVAWFKAADDTEHVGLLRLVNTGAKVAQVTIEGTDDVGRSHGKVQLTVPPKASQMLSAKTLEVGRNDVVGMLGDGIGDWRLSVMADTPIQVMSLLLSSSGHLTNLSTAASMVLNSEETAESVFEEFISPIVQNQCVICHVAGGASGNTRLVFISDDDSNHLAANQAAFSALLDEVDDGANYILAKVQGVAHGGGPQLQAGTDNFAAMERFLQLLGEDVDTGGSISVDKLFDGVILESPRQTLRRAAIVLAGRIPTDEEYDSLVEHDEDSLRNAVRGLMQGSGFHDFLITASNDRLFTDRETRLNESILSSEFVDHTNLLYELRELADLNGNEGEAQHALETYQAGSGYGVSRAPLELIAHIVENDLPYTEVLTADYIMANSIAAKAYGASTEFSNPNDLHEFQPSRIVSYYRTDHSKVIQYDPRFGKRVIDPGNLTTDYPHAGILNSIVFMRRYPSTATNRNRARSRWTYYHFLGLDVEKSASRTTDPLALADTNNPTMRNPACTVCHSVLDPVAGAYQNYGDEGWYRDQWGGMDSLDEHYKRGETTSRKFLVEADSYQSRQTFSHGVWLEPGNRLILKHHNNNGCGEDGSQTCGRDLRIDSFHIQDLHGRVVDPISWSELDEHCEYDGQYDEATGNDDHYRWWGWECMFPTQIAEADSYEIEITLWADQSGGEITSFDVGAVHYQEGDTWYRDMRAPGFDGEDVLLTDNSAQWLAQKIVGDYRFAEASVRFWWPSIMGSEVVEPPADESDADFEGALLASNAQSTEVKRLANGFRVGFVDGRPYNLKDLLVEIVLSKWFRAESLDGNDPVRATALIHAGASRLLTPEELARKTLALTGFGWERRSEPNSWYSRTNPRAIQDWTNTDHGYGLLYGGIDSDGITKRARDLTSVMAGVANRHALASACPIVLKEFYLLPDDERRLFVGIDRTITPTLEFKTTFEITAESREERETVSLKGHIEVGEITVVLTFPNDFRSVAGNHLDSQGRDRILRLDRMDIRNASGEAVLSVELEQIERIADNFPVDDHFAMHDSGAIEVPISISESGDYSIEVITWSDRAGDELAKLELSVHTDAQSSAGSQVIKSHIAELHERLFGVEVHSDSTDVVEAYDLFVDVWERAQESNADVFLSQRCDWESDQRFLEEIDSDAWVEDVNENGETIGWDWDRINGVFNERNMTDPNRIAQTWVTVLAFMLADFRYLHL